MIPITDEDRNTPVTVADLKQLANEFARQLAAAPPLQLSSHGDVVPPETDVSIH
jgi:hypothetical protein